MHALTAYLVGVLTGLIIAWLFVILGDDPPPRKRPPSSKSRNRDINIPPPWDE